MALGAAAANPSLDIKIVPVGMNYFHPDKFRSRAVVSFGHPISIDKRDIEDYKLGGEAKREAVTRLLDLSDEAFKAVTVNTPDYDTLMVKKERKKERENKLQFFFSRSFKRQEDYTLLGIKDHQ